MANTADAEKPERIYEKADMEVKYYDMLYEFARAVTRANEKSFEGVAPKRIAKSLRKSFEAFRRLCMIDDLNKGQEESPEAPQEDKKEPPDQEQTPTGRQQEEKPLPDNFLRIDKDGWGLCPVCQTRVLKVTATTRLENFPVFCKRCRADHLVNWWNADNQRIMYKRYVNERYLMEQALKGTGLRTFQNTGSSAPERVAVGRS